jgi:hypothetical protein
MSKEKEHMKQEQTKAMVLRDMDGNYYLLPLDVVQKARVPEESKAEIEAAIGGGDVAGYDMAGAVAGGIVDIDGSFMVDEDVEPWPVVPPPRGGGLGSAIRMLAGTRF